MSELKKVNISGDGLRVAAMGSGKVYIETYGCQMNVNDTEVVLSILQKSGYTATEVLEEADLILVNTCSVRENAEQRVRGRLDVFRQIKKGKPSLLVGVIGCMAERLKDKLLEEEQVVDLVVGPDSYRELPVLVRQAGTGQRAINVLLSREETYADISPVRMDRNKLSAYISIMRGCNNCCAYCIVPYTRGAERSRSWGTIVDEAKGLEQLGYKEVTLLGQNVDSYLDGEVGFAGLLSKMAEAVPSMRVRFATSHPKDMSDAVIETMAKYENVCNSIHLPFQSGSSRMLDIMRRKYSREWYLERIEKIRSVLPEVGLSTDIIAGFCGETEEDHEATLSLMRLVEFDHAFMFKYSERPNTLAARKMKDDVPEEVKSRRLQEIIELQGELSMRSKSKCVGKVYEVLVEGRSKKSELDMTGRTMENRVVVFPAQGVQVGDRVQVRIKSHTPATLLGEML